MSRCAYIAENIYAERRQNVLTLFALSTSLIKICSLKCYRFKQKVTQDVLRLMPACELFVSWFSIKIDQQKNFDLNLQLYRTPCVYFVKLLNILIVVG